MVCRISKRCCQLIRSTETRSTTYEPAKHFVNSAIDQNVITLQQKTRFSVQICQKLAQTHFLFHEYTVKYALTRISGSHVVTCGYSYKMPLICHGLIWFKTMIYISLLPKIISVRFQSPTMASDAKRQRYSVAKALKTIFDDGSERGGMSGGEESELDRKLENPSEESR